MNSKYWNPLSEGTSKAKEFVHRLKSQKKKARARAKELQSKTEQQIKSKEKLKKEEHDKVLR
jgi:hypothetical protein